MDNDRFNRLCEVLKKYGDAVYKIPSKMKNVGNTGAITPKCVTTGRAHLRGVAPGQHIFELQKKCCSGGDCRELL